MTGFAQLLAASAILLFATAASAANDKRAEVFNRLVACRAVADTGERLACYDRQVQVLDAAERAEEVVILDRAQVKEAQRSLFGFSLPKLNLFGHGKGAASGTDESLASIDAVVTSIGRDADNRLIFTIEDGARWHQIDGRPSLFIKRGMQVTLKRAALGSYFASFRGANSIRVRREG